MKRFFAAACLAATIGVAVSGCHSPANTQNTPSSPAQPQAAPAAPLVAPSAVPTKVAVYVLNPKATTEETELMPREVAVTHPDAPIKDAVTALLNAHHSPLASGVSLRGISVGSGVATLDFSASPIKEGGEGAQSAGLNALAMTLGQFPEINSYQIKVQGQAVKTFGEFSSDGPLDVIRPGTALEAKSQ